MLHWDCPFIPYVASWDVKLAMPPATHISGSPCLPWQSPKQNTCNRICSHVKCLHVDMYIVITNPILFAPLNLLLVDKCYEYHLKVLTSCQTWGIKQKTVYNQEKLERRYTIKHIKWNVKLEMSQCTLCCHNTYVCVIMHPSINKTTPSCPYQQLKSMM